MEELSVNSVDNHRVYHYATSEPESSVVVHERALPEPETQNSYGGGPRGVIAGVQATDEWDISKYGMATSVGLHGTTKYDYCIQCFNQLCTKNGLPLLWQPYKVRTGRSRKILIISEWIYTIIIIATLITSFALNQTNPFPVYARWIASLGITFLLLGGTIFYGIGIFCMVANIATRSWIWNFAIPAKQLGVTGNFGTLNTFFKLSRTKAVQLGAVIYDNENVALLSSNATQSDEVHVMPFHKNWYLNNYRRGMHLIFANFVCNLVTLMYVACFLNLWASGQDTPFIITARGIAPAVYVSSYVAALILGCFVIVLPTGCHQFWTGWH